MAGKVNITLYNSEAVFTCGAIKMAVQKTQKFCAETDAKYGDLNEIHHRYIEELVGVHEQLAAVLAANGITVDPIEEFNNA